MLLCHYNAICQQYQDMEDEYCAQSVHVRRNVLGPLPEERLYCGALPQWRPSSREFDVKKLFGNANVENAITMKAGKQEAQNELCQIWIDFFHDVCEVARLLKKQPGCADRTLIGELLRQADFKADWVE
jgi:hypothetical protein